MKDEEVQAAEASCARQQCQSASVYLISGP